MKVVQGTGARRTGVCDTGTGDTGASQAGAGRRRGRAAAMAAAAVLTAGLGGCGALQNMTPDFAAFRLPDRSTFVPTRATFNYNISPTTAVTAADLVDAQGQCTAAATPVAEQSSRGVRLDMTECEVVHVLGQPQSIDFPQADQRRVVLIYHGGQRPGIYEFTAGRLTAIERTDDAPPPAAPRKSKKSSQPPA